MIKTKNKKAVFFANLSILIFLTLFSTCLFSCAQLLNDKFGFNKTIKGSDGTLTWELDYSSNKLIISGSADKDTPFTCTRITDIDFSEVFYIEFSSGITALGDYAFSGFSKVKNISLTTGIQSAGKDLFAGLMCSVSIGSECTVSNWDKDWYKGYNGVSWLVYNDSSGENTLLVFGEGKMSDYDISYDSIYGTAISNAPWATYDYRKIIIGEGITYIGTDSFYNCSAVVKNGYVDSITFPSTLTHIGSYCFAWMPIQEITIPSGVVQIDSYAFQGWYGYTINLDWTSSDSTSRSLVGLSDTSATVLYSNGIKYNDDGISSYSAWTLKEGVLTINGRGNVSYSTHPWTDNAVTSIVISSGITELGCYSNYDSSTGSFLYTGLFQNMPNVTSVSLPDTLTTIGYCAFKGCTGITSITIPSSVTTIYDYAFQNCTSITTIMIPSSVINIYGSAFENWSSSQTIILDWLSTDTTYRMLSGLSTSGSVYYSDDTRYTI
ncbi:MAG: leucine-rich repeat domain-containing protein [Treponema sp.]|nr:leucine-rich repeat domain-containing protein [Treponema sp.]